MTAPRRAGTRRDRYKPLDWHVLLEIVGAAAGLGAVMTFVGGALLWLRFDAVHLPADRAVSLLPARMLLTVGAHALLVPALVGLLAVVFVFALNPVERDWGWALPVATGIVVVAGLVLLGVLTLGLDVFPELVGVGVASIAGIAAVLATARYAGGFRPVGWVVFMAVLFVGAALALARTANHAKLEPVAALLKDPDSSIVGFYVGDTGDRMYVAELPGVTAGAPTTSAEDVNTIVAVSRDRVTRLAIRQPEGTGTADAGREEAQTLLENLVAQRAVTGGAAPQAAVATSDRVSTFAPLAFLHSEETVPPTSVDYFLDNSWVMWAEAGKCPDYVYALGRNAAPADRKPAQLIGKVDAAGLGSGGYRHPADGETCNDKGPAYKSSDFTRPYSPNGRATGLDPTQGFYLDLDDSKRHPHESTSQQNGQKVLNPVPMYYEQHAEGDGERITYWFFYPLSLLPGVSHVGDFLSHEGDWERMSVFVRPGPSAGQWIPVSARYHEHDTHIDIPWADVRKAPGPNGLATHPLAYVGRGSHATYPRPGHYEQVFKPGSRRIIAVQDDARSCPDCAEWFTWQLLVNAAKQPWYGFGGAWGQVGSGSDTTGPLGPSKYKTHGKAPSPEHLVQQPSTVAPPQPGGPPAAP
jgi:hypothetical protein